MEYDFFPQKQLHLLTLPGYVLSGFGKMRLNPVCWRPFCCPVTHENVLETLTD